MKLKRLMAILLALVMVAAACGSSGDDDTSASSDTTDTAADEPEAEEEPADEPAAEEEPADEEEPAAEPTPTPAPPAEESAVAAMSIGLQLEPATLDPTVSPEGPIQTVLLYNIVEPLVKIDADGQIVPLLAESWEVSDDGLTYTFSLQQGATFHDGADFTADDVVFSLDRARDEELEVTHPFAAHLAPVDTITAIDDFTVEIVLSEFSANFLFFMAQSAGMIFDEGSIDDLADNPVGTGPFAFSEWVRGDHITVAANPDYWGEAPLLEEVTYRYIEDPNALNNAMLTGDIQAIAGVSAPELLEVFDADPEFNVAVGTTNGEVTMALNNREGALADVRVRQALSYGIDRQEVIDGAYFGYGSFTGTFAVPTDPYYVDLTDRYPYDPAMAQELLAEAGFADGLTIRMTAPPPSYASRSAEIIQSQLAEIGVTLEVENVEWGVWLADVFNVEGIDGAFNYDTSIVAHVEARDIIQYGNPDYYFGYDNADVQDLLAQADAEPDDETRYGLLGEVQTQITEDAASIWLFVLPQLSVTAAGVEGYVANATSQALDMSRVGYNPS